MLDDAAFGAERALTHELDDLGGDRVLGLNEKDFLYPPPVSIRDHPTRDLALFSISAELSGCGRNDGGMWH